MQLALGHFPDDLRGGGEEGKGLNHLMRNLAQERLSIAVNGDGDLTGFSVVELRADEYQADVHPSGAPLSGYVAPG